MNGIRHNQEEMDEREKQIPDGADWIERADQERMRPKKTNTYTPNLREL